jgi:hypothetical protein
LVACPYTSAYVRIIFGLLVGLQISGAQWAKELKFRGPPSNVAKTEWFCTEEDIPALAFSPPRGLQEELRSA